MGAGVGREARAAELMGRGGAGRAGREPMKRWGWGAPQRWGCRLRLRQSARIPEAGERPGEPAGFPSLPIARDRPGARLWPRSFPWA